MKRTLVWILTLILALSAMAPAALADELVWGSGSSWGSSGSSSGSSWDTAWQDEYAWRGSSGGGPSFGSSSLSSVYASTPLGDAPNRIRNIELAAEAVNGYYLPYGATFSFNSVVGPRTEERGYRTAVNGRGAKVTGGGVAQVASTVYLALQSVGGITYDELHTYGSRYNQDYVDSASDAIMVDAKSGQDFVFTNNADDMLIEVYTSGGWLCCTLTFGSDSSSFTSNAGGSRQVIGSATIVLEGGDNLLNNVRLAAESINGTELFYGDVFSFNGIVGPRSKSAGYKTAVNGRGVKVTGGGVAQVASVIWLAVEDLPDITIREKNTYGKNYNQSYVASADDAIMTDYSSDKDFSFRYNGENSIRIETYIESTFLGSPVLRCDVVYMGNSNSWW